MKRFWPAIVEIYQKTKKPDFETLAKKLTKDIEMGSIEGATLTDRLLYVGHRLVIPQDLKVCELLYNLAHDTLGHFGFDKSYESLRGFYYWPNMRRDLENAYIPSCAECQCNKDHTSKPTGPLHPLPVPDARSDTVTLDFISPLPEENGKDTILTMTDPPWCRYTHCGHPLLLHHRTDHCGTL
jgi:hypothetical protein